MKKEESSLKITKKKAFMPASLRKKALTFKMKGKKIFLKTLN